MSQHRFASLTFVALLAFATCTASHHSTASKPTWPWAEPRATYIRRSQVWRGGDLGGWVQQMRGLDLLNGPGGPEAFAFEDLVHCSVVPPSAEFSGKTQKFFCQSDGGDEPVFKVKWGAENREVNAEVAGSRLLWALGFPVDADYPVRVECSGCADDPWRDQTKHPGHVPPVFAPAVAEFEYPGRTMEEEPDQGWTWVEFARIDPAVGGAPRAQTDALLLLAAFIQHRDSKADNQRLVCMPDGIVPAPDGRLDCLRPVMLIRDLGSAFGGPSLLATHKMDLGEWSSRPLWKDPQRCIATVSSERDATDGLDDPQIGEGGRRFLMTLVDALDDDQIAALFTAARGDRCGGVAEWVVAFKNRREQLRRPVPGDLHFRCPAE